MTALLLAGSSTGSTDDPSRAPYADKAWAIAFMVNVCITLFAV